MKKIKLSLIALTVILGVMLLSGCKQADKVSDNISDDADNFKITRQITVINTRTDKVILQATGLLSVKRDGKKTIILIKTGKNEFKKHLIYENEWTASSVEQIDASPTNPYAYQYTINPEHIMHGWEVLKVENN